MFEAKTVLVLGAGASAEVGLPVGSKLLTDICNLIDIRFDIGSQRTGDPTIVSALKLMLNEGRDVTKLNQHLHAAQQVIRSSTQGISIDNIVDALEDERVERVAKLGIVRAIQLAEEKSPFFRRPDDHGQELYLSRFGASWYDPFTKALCEKVKKSEIEHIFDNVSIISFNYDRCIERYLPASIAQYYGVGVEDVRALLPKLKIVRPYGIAGLLSWMGKNVEIYDGGHGVASEQLANASEMIRTFTQGVADISLNKQIEALLGASERVIFLGFAFHPQNMTILNAKVDQKTEVIATAHAASENDRRVIQESILRSFGYRTDHPSSIIVAAESCHGMFHSYWRTITAPPVPRSRAGYTLENI